EVGTVTGCGSSGRTTLLAALLDLTQAASVGFRVSRAASKDGWSASWLSVHLTHDPRVRLPEGRKASDVAHAARVARLQASLPQVHQDLIVRDHKPITALERQSVCLSFQGAQDCKFCAHCTLPRFSHCCAAVIARFDGGIASARARRAVQTI